MLSWFRMSSSRADSSLHHTACQYLPPLPQHTAKLLEWLLAKSQFCLSFDPPMLVLHACMHA